MARNHENLHRKKPSILMKMAAIEAERDQHLKIQAEKDRMFMEALESIAKKSAHDRHGLDETKKSLYECYEIKKKNEQRTREERLRQVERETQSEALQERLSQTWYNLELNSNAAELEEWCDKCGCLHTSFVVNDDDENSHHPTAS